MIKVGCCGFPVSQKRYFSEFEVVEVQKSFYRTVSKKEATNWRKKAPEGFEFLLKAPQCITHAPKSPTYKRSDLKKEEIKMCGNFRINEVTKRVLNQFFDIAYILSTRIILFQTPPSFVPNEENIRNMEAFFEAFRGDWIFAWEPRSKRWSPSLVKEICERFKIIHVVDPFLYGEKVAGEFNYFRLHGNLKTYRYSYTLDDLKKIYEMAKPSGYVMFNNTDMYKDAKMLKDMIKDEI